MPIFVLLLAGLAWGLSTSAAVLRSTRVPSPHALSLAIQYLVFLPAVVYFLRRSSRSALPRAPKPYWALAGYAAAALYFGSLWSDEVLYSDEAAYLFQARVFAAGSMAAERIPLPADTSIELRNQYQNFNSFNMTGPRWYIQQPKGWPFVLAFLVGTPLTWLINPVLGFLLAWLALLTAREFLSEESARWALLFLVLSPYYSLNTAGLLGHTLSAVLLSAALLLTLRFTRLRRLSLGMAMLILLALALQVRPMTAAVMGVPLVVFATLELHGSSQLPKWVACVVFAGMVMIASQATYQYLYTGNPWTSPYEQGWVQENGKLFVSSAAELLENVRSRLRTELQSTVFVWLPFLPLLAASALRSSPSIPRPALLLLVIALTLPASTLLNLFISYSHPLLGERFYFEAFPSVAVLGGLGWSLLIERWKPSPWAVRALVALLVVTAMVQITLTRSVLAPAFEPRRSMRAAADQLLFTNAVVFLRSDAYHPKSYNINAADWRRAPIVYLQDPGPALREQVVCGLGRSAYAVLVYEEARPGATIETRGAARCQAR